MSDLHRPDWPLVKISDLAEINIGGTPSRAAPHFWAAKPEGSPWIAISDLKDKYVDDTKEYITDLGAKCSNVKLIEPFTTVMSFKLTVGRTAITTRPMYCNEAIAIFSPKNDALSGGWLYHALPRAALSVVTDNAVKGATLNKAKMAEMTVQLPPITEQRKIAQILDTLDTAILETEALIDKLKAVKQGLLHDLLTRGIDANGQLRPPQSEAPQLYKESPLGWIPREWEVLPLEDVADLQVGFAFKSEWFLDTGKTRLLRGDNVGYGSPEWETAKYLSDEAAQRFAGYLLKEGDVVIGMDRTFTQTGSKFSVISQDDLPCLLVQRVGRFMPRLCSMDFLRQLTLWPAFQRNLLAQQKGMDIPHLSKSEILFPFVPVPTTCEQGAISARMTSFEQRITSESSFMAKLKSQKSGLMDDLLTGRVRVTPLLESVQQAAAQTGA